MNKTTTPNDDEEGGDELEELNTIIPDRSSKLHRVDQPSVEAFPLLTAPWTTHHPERMSLPGRAPGGSRRDATLRASALLCWFLVAVLDMI